MIGRVVFVEAESELLASWCPSAIVVEVVLRVLHFCDVGVGAARSTQRLFSIIVSDALDRHMKRTALLMIPTVVTGEISGVSGTESRESVIEVDTVLG